MFFTLFHEKPALSQGWDLRHLWAAQTMIAGAIAARDKRYKAFRDPIRLRRRIKKECLEYHPISGEERVDPLLPDNDFRDIVFAGLDDYLVGEAEHILSMILSQENLDPPKPLGEAIIHALKTDDEFKRFVLKNAETLKQAHP